MTHSGPFQPLLFCDSVSLEGGKWGGFRVDVAAPLLGMGGQMVPRQMGKGTPGWPSALWGW